MKKQTINCKIPKNKKQKTICDLIKSPNTIKILDKKGNLIGIKTFKKIKRRKR